MTNINYVDDVDLFGRLYTFTGYALFINLRNTVNHYDIDLNDCFSWGQLKSKRWLIETCENLNLNLGDVFLCGGWYALLANMLFRSHCNVESITSFDIDDSCLAIAESINKDYVKDNWRFKASTLDILNLRYDNFLFSTRRYDNSIVTIERSADTIVNTSCEHIAQWDLWWDLVPTSKVVILQSNNFYEHPDHCNTQTSLSEWLNKLNMRNIYYSGTLSLDEYERYMVIGKK
jgi:hypothetical protein